jgi:hypothetical protein
MTFVIVLPETQCNWCATYAHYVCDALKNKCNNVAQDLKLEKKVTGDGRKPSIFKPISLLYPALFAPAC